jgi:hypothetical protein
MLHPSYFGPRMQQYLESKLYSDVEGTCSGQFGFIIAVVSISDIGKGMVISGNGQAEFVTRYRAIVFKPFKGEVVDGVVHNVTRVRVFRLSRLSFPLCFKTPCDADGHFCGSWPSQLFCLAAGARRVPCRAPLS